MLSFPRNINRGNLDSSFWSVEPLQEPPAPADLLARNASINSGSIFLDVEYPKSNPKERNQEYLRLVKYKIPFEYNFEK